jgi:hypothetical protein
MQRCRRLICDILKIFVNVWAQPSLQTGLPVQKKIIIMGEKEGVNICECMSADIAAVELKKKTFDLCFTALLLQIDISPLLLLSGGRVGFYSLLYLYFTCTLLVLCLCFTTSNRYFSFTIAKRRMCWCFTCPMVFYLSVGAVCSGSAEV